MKKEKEKESKSSKQPAASSQQPAASQQYICQYKIQNIVPNTFSNKESIAHKESLHNQLKKRLITTPQLLRGGGLLIPSQHYGNFEGFPLWKVHASGLVIQ